MRQLPAPLSAPQTLPILASSLGSQPGIGHGDRDRVGRSPQSKASLPQPGYLPSYLPSVVCSEQAGPWRRESSDGRWGRPGAVLTPSALSAAIPAEAQAEALATGPDLVLGLNVCEAPCVLPIDAQYPVAHSHTCLCSFASRSELWRGMRGMGAHPGCTIYLLVLPFVCSPLQSCSLTVQSLLANGHLQARAHIYKLRL